MDKRKYESKILIAEHHNLSKVDDVRFSERAYILKDGSKIIEYEGNELSIYGTAIAFGKWIGRKGVYSINDYDYEMWKSIRKGSIEGEFIDWEEERNNQFEEAWKEEYNRQISLEHESIIEKISGNELPF